MTNYWPTANTSEIRKRIYRGAVYMSYSLSGFQYGQNQAVSLFSNQPEKDIVFKIVVLGESATGKTSLLASYLENNIELKPVVTRFAEYHTRSLVLGERSVDVQLWEVPSHVLNSPLNDQCFLQKSLGTIIVYDITNRKSFERAEDLLRKFRQQAYPGAICLLVGNKIDLRANDETTISSIGDDCDWVSSEEASQFADGYSMGFFETSAYLGTNVSEVFNTMLTTLNDARKTYYDRQRTISSSASEK